ncbi:MAG: hypothetical protein WHU94_13460 [Thermogemmata sp.]
MTIILAPDGGLGQNKRTHSCGLEEFARDTTPKLNRAELIQELRAEFEELVTQVADAVEYARAGRIIADSEELARHAFAQFREKVYTKVLQKRLDAAEAAFPPSGGRNR